MLAMLRPALAAGLVVFSVPALAGGGHPPHHPPHHPPSYRVPVVRPVPPLAALPVAQPVTPAVPAPQSVLQPFGTGFYPYPVVVTVAAPVSLPEAIRPVRPLSFHVIDPRATVSRAPSGRIVVTGPGRWRQSSEPPRPYAPPAFHIVGTPSGRHMGQPVKLTHGVKPAATRPTEPRVIWIKEPQAAAALVKSGG